MFLKGWGSIFIMAVHITWNPKFSAKLLTKGGLLKVELIVNMI
ncbi:hypothetical protein MED121_03898 [Marinomonas sp. MED121]|nr:hypothetical protein MED121_03898 [Marinomonas sp. MED121]